MRRRERLKDEQQSFRVRHCLLAPERLKDGNTPKKHAQGFLPRSFFHRCIEMTRTCPTSHFIRFVTVVCSSYETSCVPALAPLGISIRILLVRPLHVEIPSVILHFSALNRECIRAPERGWRLQRDWLQFRCHHSSNPASLINHTTGPGPSPIQHMYFHMYFRHFTQTRVLFVASNPERWRAPRERGRRRKRQLCSFSVINVALDGA